MSPRKNLEKPKAETVKKAGGQRIPYLKADGTKVPGVTTILGVIAKPQLVKWANDLGLQGIDSSKHVDALAEAGKLAHKMIEDHLAGRKTDTSEAAASTIDMAENSMLKYLEWEKQRKPKLILSEARLISEEMNFGGTLDALMELDGVPTLVDFKTAKRIYDDHLFQVAAYATLAHENGHEVKALRILQIGRTPDEGFSERTVALEEIGKFWDVFEAAHRLYLAKQKIGSGW